MIEGGNVADLFALTQQKKPKPSKAREAADEFDFQLRAYRMTGWEREHPFAKDHPGRWPKDRSFGGTTKARVWRFDFARRDVMLAVEIEGLRVQNVAGRILCTGRHSTAEGYREDCRKYAAAVELGWSVLRFVQDQVYNGEAIATIERVLGARGWVR